MTFPAEPEIKSFETGNDLCLAVVELAIDRIRTGLATNGVFHLALTGGATGTLIAEHLVAIWNQTPAEFAGLHIWWGDERFLSEMSEARNARVVIQYLRSNGSIDVHEAPSSNSTINLDTAARMYRADVAGIAMDLTLLGVGPDGHVASLFPGLWNAGETRDVVARTNDMPSSKSLPEIKWSQLHLFRVGKRRSCFWTVRPTPASRIISRSRWRWDVCANEAEFCHGRARSNGRQYCS
jgi:6-phosphogluconolactonase